MLKNFCQNIYFLEKKHYIQNNPVSNSFIHNRSTLPRCAYELHTDLHTDDVIREQIFFGSEICRGGFDSKITV